MTDIADLSHPQAVAMEVLAAYAARKSLTPFSSRPGGLTLDQSTRVLPMLRAAFEARGEKILGRKIGFTNRSIWAQYGVDAPIWGYVTSATTHDLAAMPALPAREFCEPRIEPEIMFCLKMSPSPAMDEDALIACIDWLALGYEVVQSPFPDWKFKPADTVAANALHGALLIGERHAFAPTPGGANLRPSPRNFIAMTGSSTAAAAPPCSTARFTRCVTSSICSPTTRTIRLWPRARSSRPAR